MTNGKLLSRRGLLKRLCLGGAGIAAGAAAALAARKGVAPRNLAYADIKRELLRQGAILA